MAKSCYWAGGFSGATTAWATAGNWAGLSVPVSTDTVVLPAGIAYGIAGYNASAVALTRFVIEEGYSEDIGSGNTALRIDADTVDLAGSGTIFLEINRSTTVDVTKAGPSGGAGTFGLSLTGGSNAALRSRLSSNQTVGVAASIGDSARFTAVTIGGAGTVTLGEAVTMTSLTIDGGVVYNSSGASGVVINAGTVYHRKGDITALTQRGGTLNLESGDTITTMSLYDGFNVKLDNNVKGVTVTTLHIYGAGTISDPNGRMTVTNATQLHGIEHESVTWTRPPDYTIQFGAIP